MAGSTERTAQDGRQKEPLASQSDVHAARAHVLALGNRWEPVCGKKDLETLTNSRPISADSSLPRIPSNFRCYGFDSMQHVQKNHAEPVNVALLLIDGFHLSSLGAFLDLAQIASRHTQQVYDKIDRMSEPTFKLYRTRIVGLSSRVASACGISVEVDEVIGSDVQTEAPAKFQLIVIPSIEIASSDFSHWKCPVDATKWLRTQRERDTFIAASGASILLLGDAKMTTGVRIAAPWSLAHHFAERFPGCKVVRDSPIVEDAGIYSSMGIGTDHMLATLLMMRLVSPKIAQWLIIDAALDHPFPKELSAGIGPSECISDPLVRNVQAWLLQRFSRHVTMDEIAHAFNVNKKTLTRRFITELGITPVIYLQSVRINAAMLMLRRDVFSVSRTAAMVGYSDVRFFRRLFKREAGISPEDYRSKQRSN